MFNETTSSKLMRNDEDLQGDEKQTVAQLQLLIRSWRELADAEGGINGAHWSWPFAFAAKRVKDLSEASN